MSTITVSETRSSDSLASWLRQRIRLDWYTLAWLAIFLIALVTRFVGLGDRVMSHDESLHTYYSYLLSQNGTFQHTPLMHGPILFHINALMYTLFGANDFTSRLYPAILGVLMVMFPLLFKRWLGRTGALLAGLMILISPLLLFHHRYMREDTPSIFFTIVMVWCTFMYVDGPLNLRRRARWLYIFAGAMLLSLGSKEVAFMYVAIFGLFLTVYWVSRLIQHFGKRPTRNLFYTLIIPMLLGGALALMAYALLAISLATYSTLESRIQFLVQQIQNIGSGLPMPVEFSMFASWTLVLIFGLIFVVVGTALWAFRRSKARLPIGQIIIIIALALVVTSGLIVVEEYSKLPSQADELVTDPENDVVDTSAESSLPIVAVWVISGAVIAVLVYAYARGWMRKLYRFPEFDIMLLLGTFILPWLTAVPVSMTGASPVDYSQAGLIRSGLVVAPLLAVSVVFGLLWNWKRWLIAAIVFYSLFVFFFTTMFTNPMGLATGMVGSLGYWLEQQGVRRGGQPQYYYQLVIMPIYEYLPLLGSFAAMLGGLTAFWTRRRRSLEARMPALALPAETEDLAVEAMENEGGVASDLEAPLSEPDPKVARRAALWGPDRLRRPSFPLFVSFWAVYIFIFYTLAGEKMPWLGTHLTLPMILLVGWFMGAIFERVNWKSYWRRGWLTLILVPLLAIVGFQIISPFIFTQSPLGGLSTIAQQEQNRWLAVIAIGALIVAGLIWVGRQVGMRQFWRMAGVAVFSLLAVLTARTAFMAAYINYDLATEYLVYAHAAPGVKLMMSQIEEIGRRTGLGNEVPFAWGGNAWPVTWYFRDLDNATFFGSNPTSASVRDALIVYASEDIRSRVEPLLEDRYQRFEYMRMWWPSWNYYNLNAQRFLGAWDFSGASPNAGQLRQGLWDIWWNRDYDAYGLATGENYDLQNWSPGEKLYFYVRKDIASQIWDLGVGDATIVNPLDSVAANVCTDNWQQRSAVMAYGGASVTPALNGVRDITVDEQGRVFVADEFNNRIVIFNADGTVFGEISGVGDSVPLNRPNGVAINPDGSVTLADTWNYRVAEYALDGNQSTFVRAWGTPNTAGAGAQVEPVDGFWGPRDVAVDADGNVYVSDTGNKRVRVYDANGNYVRDIGSAGSELGQLDEPAGLAISPDGRLFVADTWNRRVSVFDLQGTPLYTFPVRGWYEDQGNRPYLAVDSARNVIYVGDPDAGRVLVYDLQGNCVGSFGQPVDGVGDLSQFDTVSGIWVSDDGSVYVADAGAGRVLRFDPFVSEPVVPSAPEETPEAVG
ncbi:MAG: TIGR03663 family protein [Anaerolineae bacterium]